MQSLYIACITRLDQDLWSLISSKSSVGLVVLNSIICTKRNGLSSEAMTSWVTSSRAVFSPQYYLFSSEACLLYGSWNQHLNWPFIILQDCLLTTLMNGSESSTLHSWQERRLNTWKLWSLQCIIGIMWTNYTVLAWVDTVQGRFTQYFTSITLTGCRDSRLEVPQEPVTRRAGFLKESIGCCCFLFKEVCKQDMKALGVNIILMGERSLPTILVLGVRSWVVSCLRIGKVYLVKVNWAYI